MPAVLFLLLHVSALHAAPVCTSELRGLFDIGSGSTKLTLARVKNCAGKIELADILDDQTSRPVALEAAKNARGEISPQAIEQAARAVAELRAHAFDIARDKAPGTTAISFAAAGTHAFRTATNKSELSAAIEALGIPMKEVSHAQEGAFGFEGVQVKGAPRGCGKKKLWVWDIGGGSWELTAKDGAKYIFTGGENGAEAFKSELIENFRDLRLPQPRCAFTDPTPNPIGKKQLSRAITLARSRVHAEARAVSLRPTQTCLTGIGGVHTKAVEATVARFWPQIKDCVCAGHKTCAHQTGSYRRREVRCLANFLSRKSDCDPELKGPYSPTAVSNLILVLGFMEELKVDTVFTQNVNMGHFLLTSQGVLDFKSEPIPSRGKL